MSQTWDSVWHFIERPERNVTKMKRIRESLASSKEIRSAPQMLISNRRRGDAGERMLLSQEVLGYHQWSFSGAVRK